MDSLGEVLPALQGPDAAEFLRKARRVREFVEEGVARVEAKIAREARKVLRAEGNGASQQVVLEAQEAPAAWWHPRVVPPRTDEAEHGEEAPSRAARWRQRLLEPSIHMSPLVVMGVAAMSAALTGALRGSRRTRRRTRVVRTGGWEKEGRGKLVDASSSLGRSPSVHRGRVQEDEVHGQALDATRAQLGLSSERDIFEEMKVGVAAEACVTVAMEAMIAGAPAKSGKAAGRQMAGEAVRSAGLGGDAAKFEAVVGLAVDRTVDFVEGDCGGLMNMARGVPPARVMRAVEVGVRIAVADLFSRHSGIGISLEEAERSTQRGQKVAQAELDGTRAAGGPRGRELCDLEEISVWVAVGRGVFAALGLSDSDGLSLSIGGDSRGAAGDRKGVELVATAAALECIRRQYARPDAALELTPEEMAKVGGGRNNKQRGATAPARIAMEPRRPVLQASSFFCSTYVRWYFEHRGRAEESVLMDSAASIIQGIFRSHSSNKVEQEASAFQYAEFIRNRNRERRDQRLLKTSMIIRVQAMLRGKAARTKVAELRDHQRGYPYESEEHARREGPMPSSSARPNARQVSGRPVGVGH